MAGFMPLYATNSVDSQWSDHVWSCEFVGCNLQLAFNGIIPSALSMVPPDKAGLGTAIYFSGGVQRRFSYEISPH
jgi:hypothetical protein